MRSLNPKEEQIMQILWRLEKAFVKEILEEMEPPRPPITTLSSSVRKLEAEGIVGHEAFGKTYRYFPILKKEEYRNSSFKKLVENYFEGSPEQVLSFFVKEENINIDELDQLLERLKNKENK